MQSFLRLTGYFCNFLLNYVKVAKLLSDILRKNRHFQFRPEQLNVLKKILLQKPFLQIFKQEVQRESHTDANKLEMLAEIEPWKMF